MTASCDGCALCCRVVAVDEISKPACQWCPAIERTAHGRRCGVYTERPDACRTFECIWLQSQARTPNNGYPVGQVLPPSLRPDRCHVVFAQDAYLNGAVDPNERRLVVFCDPDWPYAWQNHGPMEQIKGFLARGGTVEVIVGSDKVTLRRGTGRTVIERTDPYLGMLRREVAFSSRSDFTFDPAELMRRRP